MTRKTNKAREALAEMFVKSLEQESLPWNQPWVNKIPPFGSHKNPLTGTRYRGMNAVILWATALAHGYGDPRWVTFKQAQEKGWQIKKGSHGAKVEYWYTYDTKEKKRISWEAARKLIEEQPDREADLKMCSNVYIVFNGTQVQGIPELPAAAKTGHEFRNELLKNFSERYLTRENIPLIEGDSAFYSPKRDNITIPPKEAFVGEMDYYGTLFHECAHSTGIEKRLGRGLEKGPSQEEYAIEELRAEMAAAFILSETGAPVSESVSENNLAYVQGWAENIKKDPSVLFKAIKSANEICDYIVEKGELELLLSENRTMEIQDIAGQFFDLASDYSPDKVAGCSKENEVALTVELIQAGDTEDMKALLEEIRTYGGTAEMTAKAGLLLEKLDGFEPEITKDEEEIEL